MKVQQLKLNAKEPYVLNKPADIPPMESSVSPFYVWIVAGSRGYGKSWSILQMIQHIAKSNWYNRWVIVSPTQESDCKQKAVFDELERKGNYVERYEELNEDTLEEITNHTQVFKDSWLEYDLKRRLFDKLKKRGVKAMSDEELQFLVGMVDDDDFALDSLNEERIFGEYPAFMRRPIPVLTFIFVDDCYAERLMSKTRNNPLIKLVVNGRHQLTSMVFATQSLASIPRAIRSNTQLWSIFPTKSEKDLNVLWEEVVNAFKSKEEFDKIMDAVRSQDHGFLFIDGASLKKPHLSIGYNIQLR